MDYDRTRHDYSGEIGVCDPDNSACAHLQVDSEVKDEK